MRYVLACLLCSVLVLAGCQVAPAPAAAAPTPVTEEGTPTAETTEEAAPTVEATEEAAPAEEVTATEGITSTEAMTETEETTPTEELTTTEEMTAPVSALSSNVTVFATGLDNPRGLRFGPDGALYVAEGGQGGTTTTTAEECEQVPVPIGPYSGGMTARISKIDEAGNVTTVADGIPSNQTSADSGSLVSGVSDVLFVGDTLYALIGSAGCSHGLAGTANGVYIVNEDGSLTMVADLSAYFQENLTASTNPGDFEPDGEPYNFIEVNGDLYVVEPNRGSLEKVTLEGEVTRILDVSASEGHSVPTVVAYRENFFIGNLTTFPIFAGRAEILEVTEEGEIVNSTSGLTAVLAVVFDEQGRLYALETTTVDQQLPVPGTGRVVRMDLQSGAVEEIASGLTFPTGMTLGADGFLYVSNYGFGFPPGNGEIVRIEIP